MSWRNGSESGRVAFTVCPSPHPPPTQQQSHNVSIAIVGLPIRLDLQKFAVRLSNSAVRGEAILRVSESLPQTVDITTKHKATYYRLNNKSDCHRKRNFAFLCCYVLCSAQPRNEIWLQFILNIRINHYWLIHTPTFIICMNSSSVVRTYFIISTLWYVISVTSLQLSASFQWKTTEFS